MAFHDYATLDTQPTDVRRGTCPACATDLICDASQGDHEHDNDPRHVIEHLHKCGCLEYTANDFECLCGVGCYWFANLFEHVVNGGHDWPRLLVEKTLEEM